jgi:hypothetical protein
MTGTTLQSVEKEWLVWFAPKAESAKPFTPVRRSATILIHVIAKRAISGTDLHNFGSSMQLPRAQDDTLLT